MDEIHMDKTEELTHPSDDPYIRGLLAPGGELEWLWDATITLTIDWRVLFVDSDRGGRFGDASSRAACSASSRSVVPFMGVPPYVPDAPMRPSTPSRRIRVFEHLF